MIRGRTVVYLRIALAVSAIMLVEVGCANKHLSSSSGDQSTTTKDQPPSESVQPDRIASIEPPATPADPGIQDARSNRFAAATPESNNLQNSTSAPSGTVVAKTTDSTGIEDIYFDFDQYSIRADAQPVLDRIGRWMQNKQGASLLIEGHCDERGTLAYNLVLGERRATAARRYLENLGISGSRLHTTSYGEVRPACKDHNEGCWKYNRRARFVVQ